MIRILMACICSLISMGIIYGQDDHFFINDLEIEGNESISKNEIGNKLTPSILVVYWFIKMFNE